MFERMVEREKKKERIYHADGGGSPPTPQREKECVRDVEKGESVRENDRERKRERE